MSRNLFKNNQSLSILMGVTLYFAIFFIKFGLSLNFLLFILGGVLGLGFFWWELLFYIYTQPKLEGEQGALLAFLKQRKLDEVVILFQSLLKRHALISRSLLFIAIYFVTSFFIITSTGSAVGVGFILGLGVRYCLDISIYRKDINALRHLYTQFGDFNLSNNSFSQLIKVFLIFFLGLSVLVLK